MKKRNKVLIGSGIVLLIMVITGYGVVSAYGPWNHPYQGFGSRFHGHGFHSRAHRQDMAEFILWRMDKEVDRLKLTDAQRVKYEKIKSNLKIHFSEKMGDHQKLREEFYLEMKKENPDVANLLNSVRTHINELSAFVNENLGLLADFYDSLDSSQQRMIVDDIRERMECYPS